MATDGRTFCADAAVVTVPLGVLKRGAIAFSPPLPQRKQAVIQRFGFGAMNKVGQGPAGWRDKRSQYGWGARGVTHDSWQGFSRGPLCWGHCYTPCYLCPPGCAPTHARVSWALLRCSSAMGLFRIRIILSLALQRIMLFCP